MTGSSSGVGPLGGRGRALRVVLLGGSSLLLATAAHTLGGGTLPGPVVLAVTGFVLGLVALLATARRVRLPLLLGGLAVQQVLLHALLDTAAASSTACTVMPALDHAMAGLSCSHAMSGMTSMTGMTAMTGGWAMLAAHAAATVATAWLLARGEAWWWRAAAHVVRATGAYAAPRRVTRRPRPLTRLTRPGLPSGVADLAAPRGPPTVLA